MTLMEVLVGFAKAFGVVMFALNLGGILTWVDRRQGSLLQDRIGPNRAVFWMPTRVAQAIAIVPALGVSAAIALALVFSLQAVPAVQASRALLLSQLGIFMTWVAAIIIAARAHITGQQTPVDAAFRSLGDPRRIFYVGLIAQVVALFAFLGLSGSAAGAQLSTVLLIVGPILFIVASLGSGAYAALSMEGEEKIGIRLMGLLHPAADGLKSLFKEDFVPAKSDRFLHGLAPFISLFPALAVLATVPFADTLCFRVDENGITQWTQLVTSVERAGVCAAGTKAVSLQVVDLNIGLLYFFAVAGTGIVGAALAGWASDNKYSLLGGLRAASQMVSYEVTIILTLVGCLMIFGSIRLGDMVRWQVDNTWGIFVQPVAFFLFFAAALAETKRIPFDLPEGESEIVAGYFTEYSGMKFAMFFFGEYVAIVSASAIMATLFFGGWSVPFLYRDGFHVAFGGPDLVTVPLTHLTVVILGHVAFLLKVVALCLLQLTIRWTLPRFRYDQLMKLGWRNLLPLSLLNILATGLFILAVQSGGPQVWSVLRTVSAVTHAVIAVGLVALVVWLVLFLLKPVQRRRFTGYSSARYVEAAGRAPRFEMGS